MMSLASAPRFTERYAVTFCESSVHAGGVGNESTGTMTDRGYSPGELRGMLEEIEGRGGVAEYHDLGTTWLPSSSSWNSTVPGHEGTRTMADLEAGVLVIRDGANFLLHREDGADKLWKEQRSFSYDRLYLNSRQGKMKRKNARYNVLFGEEGQAQGFPSFGAFPPRVGDARFEEKMKVYQQTVCDYNLVHPVTRKPFVDPATGKIVHPDRKKTEWNPFVEREGAQPTPVEYFKALPPGDCTCTVKAFSELPYLNALRQAIVDFCPKKTTSLVAEGNCYFEKRSNINYHGDAERKIIICLCLGKTTKLTYCWRYPEDYPRHQAVRQRHAATLTLSHGDIYIMSEKAGGYDWTFGKNQWPEPRLVHGAAFDQAILDDFISKKRKRK